MAKKNSEIKQISKQSINILIGDKSARRKRGRPRKRAEKTPKASGLVGGFVAPIINFPPNYTNPAAVQPLQQSQSFLVPKPVAARAAPAVFNEGENLLGLQTSDPTRLQIPTSDPAVPVPISSRFTEKQEAALEAFTVRKPKQRVSFAENALGGGDLNLGSAFEPDLNTARVLREENDPFQPLKSADFIARGARGRPRVYASEEERRAAKEERRQQKRLGKLAGVAPEGGFQTPRELYESAPSNLAPEPITFVGGEAAEQPPPLSGLERERA